MIYSIKLRFCSKVFKSITIFWFTRKTDELMFENICNKVVSCIDCRFFINNNQISFFVPSHPQLNNASIIERLGVNS